MSGATLHEAQTTSGSNWRRLRHTPLRDLVRGRVTGRLDLAARINAANLPQTVGALVLLVARRTRLLRIEKADVVDELITHFLDGLESGHAPDQLIGRFGDPTSAATLIRRAKKRSRPLWWRMSRRIAQGCAALLAACFILYVVLLVRYAVGRPTISRNYLAEINRPAMVTPEAERAWPQYRQALLGMPTLRELARSKYHATLGGDRWSEVLAALQREAPAIETLRQAAARPLLGYVARPDFWAEDAQLFPGSQSPSAAGTDLLVMIQLPQLGEMRLAGRILCWDARAAADQNDGARIVSDLAAVLGMTEHVTQPPTLISQLVSFAVTAQALETLGTILARQPQVLDDDQLQELAHRIAAWRGGGTVRIDLQLERFWFEDFLQRAYTDDGSGDGRLTRQGLVAMQGIIEPRPFDWGDLLTPLVGTVVAGRKQMTDQYESFMSLVEADFAQPMWTIERMRADRAIEELMEDPVKRIRYLPVALLMPALGHAHMVAEQAIQRRDAALVAIALELYRRRHGLWPASLDQLVPALLPSVPPDRFDGKPLKYRLIDGRPVLYSIGTDRDDDGGVWPHQSGPIPGSGRQGDISRWLSPEVVKQRKATPSEWSPLPDGDWILWSIEADPVKPMSIGGAVN